MWLRYEQLDISAICEAIEKRQELEMRKREAQQKLTEMTETIYKIKAGKYTLKTFWKSKAKADLKLVEL